MKSTLVDCNNLTQQEQAYLFESSPLLPQVAQSAVIYRSLSPCTEIAGRMIGKMLEACGSYEQQMLQILSQFGIAEIDLDGWYLEQNYLDALNQVTQETTSPVLLNQMGSSLVDLMFCLPGMDAAEGIQLLNQYFHRWHRRGEAGDFRLLESNPGASSILVQCRHPYPCGMDMGLLKRLVQRITGEQQVMVFHDYRQSQHCRKTGAGVCNLLVSW